MANSALMHNYLNHHWLPYLPYLHVSGRSADLRGCWLGMSMRANECLRKEPSRLTRRKCEFERAKIWSPPSAQSALPLSSIVIDAPFLFPSVQADLDRTLFFPSEGNIAIELHSVATDQRYDILLFAKQAQLSFDDCLNNDYSMISVHDPKEYKPSRKTKPKLRLTSVSTRKYFCETTEELATKERAKAKHVHFILLQLSS